MKSANSISVIILLAFLSFTTSCAGASNKWKIGKNTITSSGFELTAGQSAINSGNFKNFDFKAHVTHSAGAKASLWFHSDSTLTKGYSVLIGNPADDRRRSGSLASVRNLYKPVPASFDLEIKVDGKRIVVMINGWQVVDYLEPADPYRTATNAKQLLSNGLIGFHVENGTLNVANAGITSLADNLPNYPAGREPVDERDDALIRLQQKNFPVIDYHVHWPGRLSMDSAVEKALDYGYEFGVADHEIRDRQVKALFDNYFTQPQLFYALQGEGREWPKILSKETREMFDYVFTDALTFNDHKGRLTYLWIDKFVIMDIPEQEYMDMIMDRTLKIINEETIDFFASPTRLSPSMMKDYDKYWTDARVSQLVNALKKNNVAMEINSFSRVPSARIIKAAKAGGVKFTLGTNNERVEELSRLAYSLHMVEECGLTIDDMWFPKAKDRYSINSKNKETIAVTNLDQSKKINTSSYIINKYGDIVNTIADSDRIITRGKGVSQELLTKYQDIVNKYLEKTSTGKPGESDKYYWKSDYLSVVDWSRLYVIFVQMTNSQQNDQVISFWGPLPVLDSAYPPNQRLYDFWTEDKKCKIYIDGEKVDNSALKSHKTTDFVDSFTSSLRRSGGKTGEYRVDLWTETGHKKFSKQPVSTDKLLEIEPNIMFVVEKDNNKPTALWLDPESRYGWRMSKVTNISEKGEYSITTSSGSPSPSTYFPKKQ